jgi:hypothetical protein
VAKRIWIVRVVAGSVLLMSGLLGFGTSTSAPVAGRAPFRPAPQQAGPNVSYGASSSLDWAGYAVSGTTFTKVQGSWVQPKATCPSKTAVQYAAFWVGIDGLSSADHTIEQIGTDSDCSKGKAEYYAWFEMVPRAVVVLTSGYPVSPGDTISAEVSGSGKNFTLQIEGTRGSTVLWHYSTKQSATKLPKASSAEWIVEDPCTATKCTIGPLADFGSVAFTNATANGLAISSSSFTSTKLTMTTKNSAVTKATPSALASSGSAFEVTWDHT